MKIQNENENFAYLDYVAEHAPKTNMIKTLIPAFIVGGIICMIGQLIFDLLHLWTSLDKEGLSSATSIIMIFLGSFFTGIGVYDRIGHYAGGGSIIPITGFANSVASPAMEFNREGLIFGVCCKMFVISGPIIVLGIVASVFVGIVGMFL